MMTGLGYPLFFREWWAFFWFFSFLFFCALLYLFCGSFSLFPICILGHFHMNKPYSGVTPLHRLDILQECFYLSGDIYILFSRIALTSKCIDFIFQFIIF